MLDSALGVFNCHCGTEFKHLDMLRLHHRLERGEINCAGTRRAMVASGKLHVVDVKAGEMVAQGFQVRRMADEAEVFLDLRVAGVVPIDQLRAGDFVEEKLEIALRSEEHTSE